MKSGFLTLMTILLLFSSHVYADGCAFYWYGYGEDTFHPLAESGQMCSIDYKNGVENMLISVQTRLEGDKAVWLFPVPAEPEKIQIDIVDRSPEYGGYEVKSKAGYAIHEATPLMVFSQVWLLPLGVFWQLGVFQTGGGGVGTFETVGSDSSVIVHESIVKSGLTTELVTAKREKDLDDYLSSRGLNLPNESVSVIKEYIGQEYSFVVSYV